MTEDKDLVSVEQWRGMNRGREDMRLTSADTNSAPSVLKACLWCILDGRGHPVLRPALKSANRLFNVECLRCEAGGPLCNTEAEAITAWNRRASDPIRAELVEALKKALADIESDPQCCGKGQPVERRGCVEEECCGNPEYGFDRAAETLRAVITRAEAAK